MLNAFWVHHHIKNATAAQIGDPNVTYNNSIEMEWYGMALYMCIMISCDYYYSVSFIVISVDWIVMND